MRSCAQVVLFLTLLSEISAVAFHGRSRNEVGAVVPSPNNTFFASHATFEPNAPNATLLASPSPRITGVVQLVVGEFKHEIWLDESVAPTVNKWQLILIVMLGGGFCGFDRCCMGQMLLGVLKCATCGGCYCWFLVDTVVLVVNALMSWKSVRAVWMHVDFHADSITPAFWVAVGLLWWHILCSLLVPRNQCKASLRKNGLLTSMPSKIEIEAAFRKLDKDDSGKISRSEIAAGMDLVGLLKSEEDIDEFMKAADKNKDDEIDFDEFFDMISKPGLRSDSKEQS